MTIEELQAQIEELKASNEAINNKNKELLGELKTARKKANEVDMDAYHSALDELENVKAENAKLSNDVKIKAKDFEKLTATLSEKDGALQNLLIDQGLTQALTDVGVPANLLKYVKADLKSQAKLQGENGEYKAMIGDKSLNDFISEWKDGDGKNVIIAPTNTGGGAAGGGGNHTSTPNRGSMNHSEKAKFIEAHGQEAYLKLPN